MSFDSEGARSVEAKQECAPDYEKVAANLKVKLDSVINVKKALFDFAKTNGIFRFQQISSYAEFIGGIEIMISEQSEWYNDVLKKIEGAK